MATITITIPDDKMPRVEDAFVAQFNYQETVPGPLDENGAPTSYIPNPETKNQFMRRQIRDYFKSVVAMHEGGLAAKATRDELG
jgi:hypothetical protein